VNYVGGFSLHTVSVAQRRTAQRRTRSQLHNVASSIVVRLKLTLFKPWKLWRQC